MLDKVFVKERIKKIDGSYQQREYLKKQKLGGGGFAECYLVERTSDKKQFALKVISKQILEKPKVRQKMLSQIKLHIQAKHKNICELYRAFEDEQYVYMLLQLCENQDMFQLIRRRKRLTIPQVQFFTYQLVDALCYLHSQGIIHRDLKLGNLLIDGNMNLKLADFGLATKPEFKGDLKHSLCGTPNYIAPEIIKNRNGDSSGGHSFEVDVWSLGVIMYFLLVGKAPFETSSKPLTYQKIQKAQFTFPEYFKDLQSQDLISKILVVDVSKRYTFQQILAHPFMNPKCGIPKSLPVISMEQIPKFGVFQKYNQQPVKKAASHASICTIRSEVEVSLSDFDDVDNKAQKKSPKKNQVPSNKASKQVITNTSVFLSKSLKKLSDLNRGSSPVTHNVSGINLQKYMPNKSNKSMSRLNISINTTNSSMRELQTQRKRSRTDLEQLRMNSMKKQFRLVYITQYKHQSVWSYILNNGYTGTYEPTYKLLYNSHNKVYIQIENQDIKILQKNQQLSNEKLNNRRRFLRNYHVSGLECEPFINRQRLVYLLKIYKVDSDKIILFRLSNGTIQAHDIVKDIYLVIAQTNLFMIQMKDGKQIGRETQAIENYDKCSAKMLGMYKQVKNILIKIDRKKSMADSKPG